MTERDALKLVYENSTEHDWPEDIWNAIKEALAKPSVSVEQEPVAYWDDEETFVLPKQKEWDKRTGGISTFGCDTPLYTTPPTQCKHCLQHSKDEL